MPCYKPLKGYRAKNANENGKRGIVFSPKDAALDEKLEIPCGQCIGCRLDKSRQWAIRCVHEAQEHEENCFITLTYDDENLPYGGTLVKKDFQDFMKRLRKEVEPKKIRYYQCGEYGENLLRPHYHAIIFNHDFRDKKLWKSKNGVDVYVSPTLQKLWRFGFSTIGTVTFESAAYVARYCVKKIKESPKTKTSYQGHYIRYDDESGYETKLQEEYATMSRRPGIANTWIKKYGLQTLTHDSVIMNGKEQKPPKYYEAIMEEIEPFMLEENKKKRLEKALEKKGENSSYRLWQKEKVQLDKAKMLTREVEKTK